MSAQMKHQKHTINAFITSLLIRVSEEISDRSKNNLLFAGSCKLTNARIRFATQRSISMSQTVYKGRTNIFDRKMESHIMFK